MLKKKCGLFLGLVVLAGSACVTPTHASSAFPLVLTHIQAGSAYSALSELVVVYNNSLAPVDVTGWCVMNKSSVRFACAASPSGTGTGTVLLPGYSSMVFLSPTYADEHDIVDGGDVLPQGDLPNDDSSISWSQLPYGVVTSQNHSSGAIVASSDSLKLVTPDAVVVDSFSWSSAPASGKLFVRNSLSASPTVYSSTGSTGDWRVASIDAVPLQQLVWVPPEAVQPGSSNDTTQPNPTTDPTTPGNSPGSSGTDEQPTAQPPSDGDTPPDELQVQPPYITELFPNPSGSDAGNEFIELYNPNDVRLALSGYMLVVGANLENKYAIPDDFSIGPHEYLAMTNVVVKFTLLNTASMVQLVQDGIQVGEVVAYVSPKSGYSWSLLGAAWVYVSVPSPNAANVGDESTQDDEASDTSIQAALAAVKPCAPNQYRNPDTGRCKLVGAAAGSLTPCKPGETRNLATNRCVAAKAATAPTPCKEGQQRNPATGRCITVKQMTTAGFGIPNLLADEGARGVAIYTWLAVGASVLAVLGYAVWEWRFELRKLGVRLLESTRMSRRFIRKPN